MKNWTCGSIFYSKCSAFFFFRNNGIIWERWKGGKMPQIIMRIESLENPGTVELISEHICDWEDGCPNIATEFLGFSRELRRGIAYCKEHMDIIKRKIGRAI
jgi:hypothetical protein